MAPPTHTSIAILSLILVFFKASASDSTSNGGVLLMKTQTQREFDYFIFALQWPGTYCQRTHRCCTTNGCCRGSHAPTEFTIHGLWPNYNDGSWPSCCSNSEFDMKEISTLSNALNKYWPSLSCGSPSTCDGSRGTFWAHEWGKHGTCSSPVIRNEYDYFLTAINLYFKYNITEVLVEAGYVPSDSEKYPLGGIISAIENAFHLSPSVVCKRGAVEELRLCFYKDFKPRDCVTTTNMKEEEEEEVNSLVLSKSSCPKYVSLPTYASLGLKNGKIIKQMFPNSEDM